MEDKMKNECITNINIKQKNNHWLQNLDFSKTRKKLFPLTQKKSALLIIDMQEYFTNETSHAYVPSSQFIIPHINQLINWYKKHENLVIFTFHAYNKNEPVGIMKKWWNDVLYVDHPLANISSQLDFSKEKDILLKKNRYSAFYNTNLEEILIKEHIEQVVITGVMTHLCCESTARDAFMKDFEVFFVIDGTATSKEELHFASLQILSDGFAIPIKTNDILKNGEITC